MGAGACTCMHGRARCSDPMARGGRALSMTRRRPPVACRAALPGLARHHARILRIGTGREASFLQQVSFRFESMGCELCRVLLAINSAWVLVLVGIRGPMEAGSTTKKQSTRAHTGHQQRRKQASAMTREEEEEKIKGAGRAASRQKNNPGADVIMPPAGRAGGAGTGGGTSRCRRLAASWQ